MKRYIINLILCIPFILSILFFIKRSTMQDIVEINGVLIEQGFGYSAMGVILFILGILLVCIRIGIYFYIKLKFNNKYWILIIKISNNIINKILFGGNINVWT